ncbi:MAG: hypothetical protein VB835_14700 [Pirellulales bacterium]
MKLRQALVLLVGLPLVTAAPVLAEPRADNVVAALEGPRAEYPSVALPLR